MSECRAKTQAEAEEKFEAERATAEVSWPILFVRKSTCTFYSTWHFLACAHACTRVHKSQVLIFFLVLFIPHIKATLLKTKADAEASAAELASLKEQAVKDAASLESAKQMVVALRNECATAKAEAAAAAAVVAAASSSSAAEGGNAEKPSSSSSSGEHCSTGEATTTTSSHAAHGEDGDRNKLPSVQEGDDSPASNAAKDAALGLARKRISVLSAALKAAEARADSAEEESRRLEMLLANNNGNSTLGSVKDGVGSSSNTSDGGKGGGPPAVNLRAQAASAAILLADARSEVNCFDEGQKHLILVCVRCFDEGSFFSWGI